MARALRLADGPDEVHRGMVARLEHEVPMSAGRRRATAGLGADADACADRAP
jgi:hypothetical protein